jgi:uncharacterized protein
VSITNFALLLMAGGVAGFLNTLAGGGSLLTLPLFVMMGLSWESANATSRVAVLLQSMSAVWGFLRYERFPWRETLVLAIPATLGAIVGALATHVMDAHVFEPVAVILLVAIGLAMLFIPRFTRPEEAFAVRDRPIVHPLLFVVGIYAGFIQAGVGYLLLAVFSAVLGRDLATGNAIKVALVLIFTLVALPILGLDAPIDWSAGLVVGAGSIVGAQLAVRFAVRSSPQMLRVILIGTLVVVIVAAIAT